MTMTADRALELAQAVLHVEEQRGGGTITARDAAEAIDVLQRIRETSCAPDNPARLRERLEHRSPKDKMLDWMPHTGIRRPPRQD